MSRSYFIGAVNLKPVKICTEFFFFLLKLHDLSFKLNHNENNMKGLSISSVSPTFCTCEQRLYSELNTVLSDQTVH